MKFYAKTLTAAVVCGLLVSGTSAVAENNKSRPWYAIKSVQIGSDINAADNPFIQPQDAALAGGGRDQTLQFGDVLNGTKRDDLQIGGLGIDVMKGGSGADVMIGGLEHFNPLNRDRAFGERGSDIFIWKPGDGSDFFDGGRGHDVVVFGVVGENDGGFPVFGVSNDQLAGEVFIDPLSRLPEVDVSGSPGFCEVIDAASSDDAQAQLDALGLDTAVQFSIRSVRQSFEDGTQDADNGLRVTLHLKSVETLICTNRDGGAIEILDLTQSPAVATTLASIPSNKTRARLQSMLF